MLPKTPKEILSEYTKRYLQITVKAHDPHEQAVADIMQKAMTDEQRDFLKSALTSLLLEAKGRNRYPRTPLIEENMRQGYLAAVKDTNNILDELIAEVEQS